MEGWVLANLNEGTVTGQSAGGGEPPAVEWLIAQGVVDRVRLQALPAIKRRRLEQTALEVQQVPAIKIGIHAVWQVKVEEGNLLQGGTWVDMIGRWSQKCEEMFQQTREYTDEAWDTAFDTAGNQPCMVRREQCGGPPGYHVVFTKRQIFQVDGKTQTMRPVRRLELSWGEDSVVTYANDDSSE